VIIACIVTRLTDLMTTSFASARGSTVALVRACCCSGVEIIDGTCCGEENFVVFYIGRIDSKVYNESNDGRDTKED